MKSRITGYLLLFVVSVAIFLVVLFPGHQLAAYFSQTLTHPQKNIYTNIENVHLSLPFSLKSKDARISMGRDFTVQPDFIKIRLGPGLVFGDQKQIHFDSGIYKGFVKGSFGFEDTQPVAYTNVQLNLSGLEFNKIRYATRMAQITMTGKIDGDYRYDADTDTKNDPGQGSILIKAFSAELTNSLFNRLKLSRIDFSRVDIRFTQEQDTINLSELTASGSVINIKLSGIIQLEDPVVNSRLTLTGAVLPDSPYLASFANSPAIKALVKNIKKDGIRFAVKGTLRQPEIKI